MSRGMALGAWGRTSLRWKLVTLVSVLVAAVAAFLLVFLPRTLDRVASTWSERRAEATATLLARMVAPGLEFDDAGDVEKKLEGLAAVRGATFAEVRRAEGLRFAAWHAERVPPNLAPTSERFEARIAGDTLVVAEPVETKGGEHALLLVGLSLAEVQAEQRTNLTVAGLVSLAVLALGILAAFFTGTVLVRPLQRMTGVALRIADGDLAGAQEELGADEGGQGGSADEVALLAASFGRMLQSLRETSAVLKGSADLLARSMEQLEGSATQQGRSVQAHAAALQQTHATAREISVASTVAAEKARTILEVTDRAGAVSRAGEQSVESSELRLAEIRACVDDIAGRIRGLDGRTKTIGQIAQMVKGLADQSNMLALNAAIEAVRSGEHGRGFGVVAREMRSLADQSIQATTQVRQQLEGLVDAMEASVAVTEEGAIRIDGGLTHVRQSGDSLRQLSVVMRDNAAAVREITSAVSQQNVGIEEIFRALTELSGLMHDTITSLSSTNDAVGVVKDVSRRVSDVAARYRL